jgi:hypothetical protein
MSMQSMQQILTIAMNATIRDTNQLLRTLRIPHLVCEDGNYS